MKFPTTLLVSVTSFVTIALGATHVGAQPSKFPDRPVKVVVAFAAGGNNDVPMRIVTTKLSQLWGVGVVVDNRAGAGGIVGTDYVAKAMPDGYTLLNCNSATHGTNPALHKKLPYDVVKNFSAVSLVGSAPNVLIVPVASPIQSAQEFIEGIKAGRSNLSIATAGIGSTQHFSLELLKSMTGADLVHLPYKGGALALADVIGGQVPAAITGLPTALASIKAGKVRALAVTTSQRSSHVPEVPTFAEAGLQGYEVTTWTGLCAPAGTPQPIVDQVSAGIRRALESPDTRLQLIDAGVEPTYLPAERLNALIAGEVKRFSSIVEKAKIVVEQ
jgi:tripartite-type tricarboxylate transporter receptor subunit TctC